MSTYNDTELSKHLRSQVVYQYMILATLLGLGFSALFALVHATNSLYGALGFFVSVLCGWYFVTVSKEALAAIVVNLSMLMAIFWVIIFSGGFHSPFLIWLTCPPLIVGLLVNWRWSLICGGLIFVFAVAVKLADHSLVAMSEFQVTHKHGMPHTVALLSVVTAVGTVIFFSFQNYRELTALIFDAQKKERTDSLTGILNRAGFNQVVATLSNNKSSDAGALIMFDVDSFKAINDTHGHMFGDYVLQNIATQVKSIIREQDAFARIGGDEFAVILPGAPHEKASTVGKRIKEQIDKAEFHTPSGTRVQVAVSVGVATCEDGGLCKTEPMMHLADAALYEAKKITQRVSIRRLEQFIQSTT